MSGKKFNRNMSSRKALLIGLIKSLVEYGKISTTLPKAKFLRPEIEKIVTMSKTNSLNNRRLLISRIGDKLLVSKLLDQIGPMFMERNGGYTRILKMVPRNGDASKMAEISFVEELKKPVAKEKEETKVKAIAEVSAEAKPAKEEKKPVVKKPRVTRKVKSEGDSK